MGVARHAGEHGYNITDAAEVAIRAASEGLQHAAACIGRTARELDSIAFAI